MGRAAVGVGWLLWRQNRVGLTLIALYLATVVVVFRLVPEAALGPAQGILEQICLGYGLLFLAMLGCMNLCSGQPGFKPHLFTLPMRTSSLVLWHMIYPIVCVTAAWLACARLLLVPALGYGILLWPAALIATLTATWRAVLWYPAAWYLRPVIIIVGMVGPIFLLSQVWIHDLPMETISEPLLICVPLAVFAAVRGVERVRRGVADASSVPTLEIRQAGGAGKPAQPFGSARTAQVWLEWRTNGIILPVMVAFIYLITIPLVSLIVGMLGTGFSPSNLGVGHIQVCGAFKWGIFLIPTTALLLTTAGAGTSQGTVRSDGTLEPFFAARAMTSWDLATAKMRTATQSALATWGITFFLVCLWLLLPATDGARSGIIGSMLIHYGPPRIPLYILAGLLVLMIWSWRAGVCAMFMGLSGRRWLGWIAFGLFVVQGFIVGFLRFHPTIAKEVTRMLPDPALALAIVKAFLAVFVFFLLRRKNLAGASTLIKVCGGWLLVVVALSAFLIWLLPPALAPARTIAAGVVLLLPLVRPMLAPLALDWNRHR